MTSVFGRIGDVVAGSSDYLSDQISDAGQTNKWATQAVLDQVAQNTIDIAAIFPGLEPVEMDLTTAGIPLLEEGKVYLMKADIITPANNFVTLPAVTAGLEIGIIDINAMFQTYPVTVTAPIDGAATLVLDVAHCWVNFFSHVEDAEYKTTDPYGGGFGSSGGASAVNFAPVNVAGDFSSGQIEGTKSDLGNGKDLVTLSLPVDLVSATTPWTPALIATSAWYDSNVGITEVGNLVSQWDDQSGNNNHMVQADGAQQPTYTASDALVNNHPTVGTPSANGRIGMTSQSSITIAETYCVVYYKDGVDGIFDGFNVLLGSASNLTDGIPLIMGTGASANWFVAPPTLQEFSYRNGTGVSSDVGLPLPASVNRFVADTPATDIMDLLFTESFADRGWIGAVAEMVFVPTALSVADRQNVEGYLAWKYGITLVAGHPYEFGPPPPIPSSDATGAPNIIPADFRPDFDLVAAGAKRPGEDNYPIVTLNDTLNLKSETAAGVGVSNEDGGQGRTITYIRTQ